jgi:hypothetical protein
MKFSGQGLPVLPISFNNHNIFGKPLNYESMDKEVKGWLKKSPREIKAITITTLLLLFLSLHVVHASVITICETGCDNSSIQEGVDFASSGDTILVGDGTYTENIDVTKSVNIMSVNGSTVTIVKANLSTDHTFNIQADNVNFSGFTV